MRSTPPLPLTRDLVLVGGGHAHALVLRRWGMAPLAGVRVTVINPEPTAPYTGMLPGHVAGHYDRAALEIDLVRLARFAGARFVAGRAIGIDWAERAVIVPGRAPVGFDIASVDIGITAGMPEIPGFMEHATGAKPLDRFATAWDRFLSHLAATGVAPDITVIGGGVAGVELAMAMAERLHALGHAPRIRVLEAGDTALAGLGQGARSALLVELARRQITLLCRVRATEIRPGEVVLSDGRCLPSAFTLGAAGARPQAWLADTGLHLTEGFVTVDAALRSVSDPTIFAVGDCAHMSHAPRPKAGVFAVRQAPVLHHNLRAALSGGRLRHYHPQRHFLKLVSMGGRMAVADKAGLRLSGRLLWKLKDRIDDRFMRQFRDLPAMAGPDLPARVADGLREEIAGNRLLCGGCGSKVARSGLAAALPLRSGGREDIFSGPGDDAAVLRHGGGVQVFTTDHLRAFTDDAWLMARLAAIHALGDIWAMGAAPQAALASIALPRMSDRLQARTLAEIRDGAAGVFDAAGAEIVGGHTSLGAELTIGFAITGLADRIVGKAGARAGDALILTKALGTGVILAAEMRQAAAGGDVAAAFASMSRSVAAAGRLLAPEAHAMTDVTGFGLAGHLLEMLDASGCGARLNLDAVPLLPGAEALAAGGHEAFVTAANRAGAARMRLPRGTRADLLFDPQTAGGLLAAVPAARADGLVAALRDLGDDAAAIGTVTAGPPFVEVV